ncbi:hypothetical protein SAMN06265222_10153 [Neorhodopirellula lusitana]|uniref:Uncharacterized protein n=1 Tax=Neorhodopirellula lusitana TaxID=445327 RepID=A0ABY1PR47_9BACT|nr:hypothetical protein SAMN06265222_10153 [Neorhodopirellula lusitana]
MDFAQTISPNNQLCPTVSLSGLSGVVGRQLLVGNCCLRADVIDGDWTGGGSRGWWADDANLLQF